jgi:hypothetical protein
MRMAEIQVAGLVFAAAFLTGCYEELPPAPSQARTTPAPAATPQTGTATVQGNRNSDVPVASPSSRGTLAGAKRTAESIAQQAEDASQRVADEADDE